MSRKYEVHKHLEFPPKDETEQVADSLQWLLHLPQLSDILPRPVNARFLVKALHDVADASFRKDANPNEVLLGWQILLDVMGPMLFAAFYDMGAWQDFTPYVSSTYDTRTKRTLWCNDTECVVLWLQYQADEPRNIRLSIEQKDYKA